MAHTHFTRDDRIFLAKLIREGLSVRSITRILETPNPSFRAGRMDEAALCHKLPACARFFRALYAEAYRCRFSDGLRVLPGRVGLSLFGTTDRKSVV